MDMDDSDLEKFNDNILLVNTEITRKSSDILMDQKVHMDINAEHLHTIKAIAEKSEEYFKSSNYGELGNLLNISWNNKKILANKISNCKIDEIYENGKKQVFLEANYWVPEEEVSLCFSVLLTDKKN